jgi:hypothetical protein
MLTVSLGSVVASDLGLAPAFAVESSDALHFGKLEPLVALLQETPPAKLMAVLVGKLKSGTDLRTLVAAGALANARSFGGQHYEGYHTFMALAPAYEMARELPEAERPLPVLKVLYRNATHIQSKGGRKNEALKPVRPIPIPAGKSAHEILQDATRKNDPKTAEATFATLAQDDPDDAFNHALYCVEDNVNVHRVVLAWRAWTTLDFTGKEHAHTLLRQTVLFCCNENSRGKPVQIQTLLPKLIDQYKLVGKRFGSREGDDTWVERLAEVIYSGGRERAADAAAAAISEGFTPASIGEAITLAANKLLLNDPGRDRGDAAKPVGSVHGDSVGLHASDAANAWRCIARVSDQRHAVASLIVGAYHTAGQHGGQLKDSHHAPELQNVRTTDCTELLRKTRDAIQDGHQASAAALVQKYGEVGYPERPLLDLLLKYGVSEDGALHAEKYYRTATEEFSIGRPAFRWRQLIALARVTASEYGRRAPGYDEARRLLGI